MIWVYLPLIFIFGALLTSFFHVIALRIPNQESINGRSYCPNCHHQLRLIDIFPIFGYLINKGRCHFCKLPIPISHLLLEILGGGLFVFAYLMIGFELELVIALILISVFLIESISDAHYMIVIDRIWMIGIVPIIAIRIIEGDILKYLLSSVILFTILYGFAWLGKKMYHKEAFGGGDVKIYIFIGFCLTWTMGIFSLFIASLFGLLYGVSRKQKGSSEIPLIPFIFIGVLIAYFYGEVLINWYLNLLGV
ncbi:MAG: prepilin peptidase [Tenericutes bacterium HGW-Tenericutes-3]|nr:MAG: prepilin peptidase [Tenericutes bacterium HGW-Tenericutes-3]